MMGKPLFTFTNDLVIREALKHDLNKTYKNVPNVRIIEELGISHGTARVDLAVVNGIIHGYEFKSDLDTLHRLPEQMKIYNAVLDQVTLIVGKSHAYEAIKLVPDWWGIVIAKVTGDGTISFLNIRDAEANSNLEAIAIARLLWREEAISILEEMNEAKGFRSKPRSAIYKKLITVLDLETLRAKTRHCLYHRSNWRSDQPHMINGD